MRIRLLPLALLLIISFPATSQPNAQQQQLHQQQQQQQQRQILQKQYAELFIATKALSTCPALIADWEYDVALQLMSIFEIQLTGFNKLPKSFKNELSKTAEQYSCSDEKLAHAAKAHRNNAALQWMIFYKAVAETNDCKFKNDPIYKKIQEALKERLVAQHGESVIEHINQVAAQRATEINSHCLSQNKLQGKPTIASQALKITWAPQNQINNLINNDRSREFWSYQAKTNKATARRTESLTSSNIDSYCGSFFAGSPGKPEYRFSCRLKGLGDVSTLAVSITDIGPRVNDIKGVNLVILDAPNSKVLKTFSLKASGSEGIYQHPSITASLKNDFPADSIIQVHINASFDDNKESGFSPIQPFANSSAIPVSFRVGDVLDAEQWARADYKDDLSYKGAIGKLSAVKPD